MTRRTIPLTLVLGLSLALPTLGLASSPLPDSGSAPEPDFEPTAWLRGPFGAVPGGTVEEPATAAPDERPLDTWMRGASLGLSTDPPLETLVGWTVTARLLDTGTGPQTEVVLARDARWLEAPDQPGRHLVRAVLEAEGARRSEHAWLLHVPDREGSWETLLEMPMLDAELHADGRSVAGVRGHGCYADMCQEVGLRPPTETLEPIVVSVGQPLSLELADGSALVGWKGRIEPQPGTASETRLAEATFDEPMAGPVLTGLEPDAAGAWLVEVRADFDRERGWQWYLYRVVAE